MINRLRSYKNAAINLIKLFTAWLIRDLPGKYGRLARYYFWRILFVYLGSGGYIDTDVRFYAPEGINCANNVMFGRGSIINAAGGLRMGNNILMGPHCYIWTSSHDYLKAKIMYIEPSLHVNKSVTIGSNVWIGAGVCIAPGSSIGNNCVIGMGAVVAGDIPDNSVAVGNPAKVVKTISSAVTEDDSEYDIVLKIRKTRPDFLWASGQDNYIYNSMNFDSSKICLMIMDTWQQWQDDGLTRQAKHIKPKICRMVEWADKNNILVIYNNGGIPMDETIPKVKKSMVINFKESLYLEMILTNLSIETIIYTGFHSNACLLLKHSGFFDMFFRGFKTIIVREATGALENPESMPSGNNRAIIDIFDRYLNGSISVKEIKRLV